MDQPTLVTASSEPSIVMVSSTMNSVTPTAVQNSPLIFLDNSIILPNDQPDILQQALEAALPSSSMQQSTSGAGTKVTTKGKENFVTVFDSRDGTLRLTQENARALGIGGKNTIRGLLPGVPRFAVWNLAKNPKCHERPKMT